MNRVVQNYTDYHGLFVIIRVLSLVEGLVANYLGILILFILSEYWLYVNDLIKDTTILNTENPVFNKMFQGNEQLSHGFI